MDLLQTILYIFLGIYVGSILIALFANSLRKKRQYMKKFIVLSLRVPRETEIGPIAAEQMYSALHGIYEKIPWYKRLLGGDQEKISFEIGHVGRNINFFVSVPKRLQNVVEGQIYAQYPNVEIDEIKDYSLNIPEDAAIFGAELELHDPDIFPIKRYSQFEDQVNKLNIDPLASITSTFAKLPNPGGQAWLQIVVKPLSYKWRYLYMKCIQIIRNGLYSNFENLQKFYIRLFTTRNKLLRIILFPLYWIFFFQKYTTSEMDKISEDRVSQRVDKESVNEATVAKVAKLLYETEVRIAYIGKAEEKAAARVKVKEIASSFKQFNIPHINGFEIQKETQGKSFLKKYQHRTIENPFILNVEELASIYHLPNIHVSTPNISWVTSRKLEPPTDLPTLDNTSPEELTLIGETNYRTMQEEFGVKKLDRRRHFYIIGKTGMGKTTLLENMIYHDIQSGKGVGIIDPHGDLAENVLKFVPSNRTNDVVIFDPSDRDYPIAFNMLENVDPSLNTIVCSGLIGIFKKLYEHSWGPRLEHILRNTILALLESPNTTMLGITRLLQDRDYRRKVVKKVEDPTVKAFFEKEFEVMQDRMRVEAVSPILNKVGQFLSSPIIRNIVGQPKSTVDLRFFMDKGKIVIMNLSKGKIGEDNSSLLGSMLITKFQLDAMSRANIPEDERKDFYLYVDEFQNFATESFATILSEARKYRLNLTMANQYIAQMPEEVRDAVFGNVGSLISFQVGYDDAEYLSQQYAEEVIPNDLVSLQKYTAYTRLLVEGMPSKTFSFNSMPPPALDPSNTEERTNKLVKVVRERYSRKREMVEDKIKRWSLGTEENEDKES